MYNQNYDYLEHHGILGQRWGVRRYQNPDGSLTLKGKQRIVKKYKVQGKETLGENSLKAVKIPAGSKLYRTVADKNESESGAKYVTYFQNDRKFYRSGGADWIASTNNKRYDQLSEKTFTLKEDLNIPTRQQAYETYKKTIIKDNKAMQEAGKAYIGTQLRMKPGVYKILSDVYDDSKKDKKYFNADLFSDKKVQDSLIKRVDEAIAMMKDSSYDSFYKYASSYGLSQYTKDKMMSELKKQGFNAMTDEFGVGGHNGYSRETRQAIIVFDGNKSFDASKTKTSSLALNDYNGKYQRDYKDWKKYYKQLTEDTKKLNGDNKDV